jgi:hypothetical protein
MERRKTMENGKNLEISHDLGRVGWEVRGLGGLKLDDEAGVINAS